MWIRCCECPIWGRFKVLWGVRCSTQNSLSWKFTPAIRGELRGDPKHVSVGTLEIFLVEATWAGRARYLGQAGLLLGVAAYQNEVAESIYESRKKEPLGLLQ